MKLPLWFAAITLGTVCWLPTNANAQGGGTTDGVNPNRMPDYYTNPTLADTMIRNRREQRRREERLRQRRDSKRGRRAATDTRRTAARRAGASAVKPAAPLPRYGIEFRRDSYQDFHREDINGFRVNFTFVSVATGKTIPKSGVCQLYDQGDPIEGIPAGVYTVRAEVSYRGQEYPAHLGSQEGSVGNRRGGDFAPSMKIELKPAVDDYGSRVMGITPGKIYVRVLE